MKKIDHNDPILRNPLFMPDSINQRPAIESLKLIAANAVQCRKARKKKR